MNEDRKVWELPEKGFRKDDTGVNTVGNLKLSVSTVAFSSCLIELKMLPGTLVAKEKTN